MGCKIAQVIIAIVCVLAAILLIQQGLRHKMDKDIEQCLEQYLELTEAYRKKITAEYKPYTDFYLEYSSFSDIEKSYDLVKKKVLEYNAWFSEKQKLFVLGELSRREGKILEKIALIPDTDTVQTSPKPVE